MFWTGGYKQVAPLDLQESRFSHEVTVDTQDRLNALGGSGPQPFTQGALIGAHGQPNHLDEHLLLPRPFHVRQGSRPGSKTQYDLRHQRAPGKARVLLVPRINALDLGEAVLDIKAFGQTINAQLTAKGLAGSVGYPKPGPDTDDPTLGLCSVALHPASRRCSYGSLPHHSLPHRGGLPPLSQPALSGAPGRTVLRQPLLPTRVFF